MKILFTGGGTGGHFYPLIAIAERANEIIDKEKIIGAKLYYMADTPYDKAALFENSMTFVPVTAGKLRLYFSLQNFLDIFKTIIGTIQAFFTLFVIYPDVIVSKGGYVSFPALCASRILRIPVVIHESDSAPGRVNLWAGKFAERIGVSFPEAGEFFPKDRVAVTGQPIRKELLQPAKEGAFDFFKLDPAIPVILILGGSQGAELINNTIIDALPTLLNKYQVIHQTGMKNIDAVRELVSVVVDGHQFKDRYHPVPFLNVLATKMAAGCTTIIISRAGSAIFEIAGWGVPSIIIPITNSNGDHQRKNAFNYARRGACSVVEESNLTPNVLALEIDRLVSDPIKMEAMHRAALAFATPDASEKIAREVINIALKHEE